MERYYNENPQVTTWKETAHHWEQFSKECLNTAKECNETCADYKKLVGEANEQAKEAIGVAKEWEKTTNTLIASLKRFNSLPWYKKMFFEFKV